jgi:hypothetical protein
MKKEYRGRWRSQKKSPKTLAGERMKKLGFKGKLSNYPTLEDREDWISGWTGKGRRKLSQRARIKLQKERAARKASGEELVLYKMNPGQVNTSQLAGIAAGLLLGHHFLK